VHNIPLERNPNPNSNNTNPNSNPTNPNLNPILTLTQTLTQTQQIASKSVFVLVGFRYSVRSQL